MSSSLLTKVGRLGISGVAKEVRRRGMSGVIRLLIDLVRRPVLQILTVGAEDYKNPSKEELQSIELALTGVGIPFVDYRVNPAKFMEFRARFPFPSNYHGGEIGGVYEEKVLEHFVAWAFLELSPGDRYLDIAGASSPWAALLHSAGIEAYSIDQAPTSELFDNKRYIKGDATATGFPDCYFDGASAQCAYEMFEGDGDIRLLGEAKRILKPGGRMVILPLYMHTHACYYQTPDYWGTARGDHGAKAYIRRDAWRIPASRKYSAQTLRDRVYQPALQLGLSPQIYVLRNGQDIASNIYLHFILVIDKRL